FPAGMPQNPEDLPRPWVQNRPVVYVVIALASLIGDSHFAWVVMNLVFTLLSLYLLYRLMKLEVVHHPGLILLAMAVFLFIPLNFYLVMQALPEIFNELLTLVITFTLLSRISPNLKAVLAAVITGILIYQRD